MPKGNNVIPNIHYKKEWHVKTWFNQPARKLRRRLARKEKATRVFPRPVSGPVRPLVHGQTQKYNAKVKIGRGFSLEELREVGVSRFQALSIGIAVDYRRRNKSDQSFRSNVQRLKEYKSKLVLFPRHPKKPIKGEASKDETSKVAQLTGDVLPVRHGAPRVRAAKISDVATKKGAYATLRQARTDARLVGKRAKRLKEKQEQAALAAAKESK